VEAQAARVDGDYVVLSMEGGRMVKILMTKLVAADRELLRKHFRIGEVQGSGDPQAAGLPYPLGEVSGPIQTPEGSNYLLYIPNSLKKGRKVALLFYTHSGGGSPKLLKDITEGAELCSWIMAISVESKNHTEPGENLQHSKNCVKHILDTLPVDDERVYFMGNSGGGATAFSNAAHIEAAGVMPNVAYVPSGIEPKADDFFIIGGGRDFNRYHSAAARKRFGDKAVHRMHPGGHGVSPAWLMIDGMLWFEGRYLARERATYSGEAKDFNASMMEWLKAKQQDQPYRAYATARFLMDEYRMVGTGKTTLRQLVDELGQDSKNVAYYDGLQEIDHLSKTTLEKFGHGSSMMNHRDEAISAKAIQLASKYQGVPVIEDVLKSISQETDALGKGKKKGKKK